MANSTGFMAQAAAAAKEQNSVFQFGGPSPFLQQTPASAKVVADVGTDPPVRSLTQTQSIQNNSVAFRSQDPLGSVFPYTNEVGSRALNPKATKSIDNTSWPNDDGALTQKKTNPDADSSRTDSPSTTANATQNALNKYSDSSVTAQANVLDKFSSFTYGISLYMITSEDYGTFLNTKSVDGIPSSRLLIQSGGIPAANRNEHFKLDYFIQSLSMTTVAPMRGGDSATTNMKFHMTVTEPYGITLPINLARASYDLFGDTSYPQHTGMDQHYLLVIRFYGYDEDGNMAKGGKQISSSGTDSIVTKVFPVIIQNFKYRVANKMVEYEFDMMPNKLEAVDSKRSTIPFDFETTAHTVREVLIGSGGSGPTAKGGDGRATGGAQTAPKSNASSGTSKRPSLMETLNAQQAKLVSEGMYEVADKYVIKILDDAISSAKITIKGGDLKMSDMDPNAKQDKKLDPDKQSTNNTVRQITFQNGVQIQSVIEQVLKSSSYITDQSKIHINENTGEKVKNQSQGKETAWWTISTQSKPLTWDKKRHMYAYEFTYVIAPYKVQALQTPYFDNPAAKKKPDELPVVKRYDYWFTGLNSEVLEFELKMDNTYVRYMSNVQADTYTDGQGITDRTKVIFSPTSGQSSQGAEGKPNEIGASAADYLYDTTNASDINMTILGDPAWITQDDDSILDEAALESGATFLRDGTISLHAGDILYEILVGTPQDYNLETGLMNPNDKALLYPELGGGPGMGAQSFICVPIEIKSEFNRGKFTQQLKGRIFQYEPDQTTKAAGREGAPIKTSAARITPNLANTPKTNPGTTAPNNSPSTNNNAGNGTSNNIKTDGTTKSLAFKPPTSTGDIKLVSDKNTNTFNSVFPTIGLNNGMRSFQRGADILNSALDGAPTIQTMSRES